jgi:CRP-like cAMP-binding protein
MVPEEPAVRTDKNIKPPLEMAFELLLQNISRHITLTAEEESLFVSMCKVRRVKKKQMLLQEGDVDNHGFFVTKGCLRSYAIDKNGYDHVLQFAPAGWWIADVGSLLTGKPGVLFIDAIDNSEILMLSRVSHEILYEKIPRLERYFRIIAERAFAASQRRLIDTLSLSALERYKRFAELYPALVDSLPQKQIASYIGVTPEFLSKMLRQDGIR